jgi:hypothetical protein
MIRRILIGLAFSMLLVSRAWAQVVREPIEWLDVWVPDTAATDHPRVLLIGDSITRAYYPVVETKLQGKAYVGRLATSKSVGDPALIQEVSLVLSEYHFDIIHFNNGMHGWGYTEDQYREHFPEFLSAIQNGAKGARLIWATVTPIRQKDHTDQLDDRTKRVKVRNQIAAAIIGPLHIPVDDLFSLVIDHPEYSRPDGVHFQPPGVAVEAEQVASSIEKAMAGQ